MTIPEALVLIARAIVIAACIMKGVKPLDFNYYCRELGDGQ